MEEEEVQQSQMFYFYSRPSASEPNHTKSTTPQLVPGQVQKQAAQSTRVVEVVMSCQSLAVVSGG